MVKAQLQELIQQILAQYGDAKLKKCTEALELYNSIELWCIHAELVGVTDQGLKATKYHFAKSHLYWNRYLKLQKDAQPFLARLAVPHMEIDHTLALYSQFVSNAEGDYVKLMSEATNLSSSIKSMVLERQRWELNLLNPTLDAYIQYIEWERVPELKLALFERAVCHFSDSPVLWHLFIQYLWTDLGSEAKAAEVCARAVVLCPCESIDSTSVLLGGESKFPQAQDSILSQLCVALEQTYSLTLDGGEFIEKCKASLSTAKDPDFCLNVCLMALIVDKTTAKFLWQPTSDTDYAHWLTLLKIASLPDASEYYAAIIQLDTDISPVLREKLQGYLMMAMRAKVDAVRLQLNLERKKQAASETQNSSEADKPKRNREAYSLVICGSISKEKLYEILAANNIVSCQQSGGYFIVEMSSEIEKKRAIAAIQFSKIPDLTAFDALNTTVWLTNYPETWTQMDIQTACEKHGKVIAVRVPHTNGRRFCYVQMATTEEAMQLISEFGHIYPNLVAKLSDPTARQRRTGAVEEGRQLYISGLDFQEPKSRLQAWLTSNSVFQPEAIHIPATRAGKQNDGYAFVSYASHEQATECLKRFNGLDYAARPIRASISRKRTRGQNSYTLIVRNAASSASISALVDGEVKYDSKTGSATVLFDSENQMGKAMLQLNGKVVDGEPLVVEVPEQQTPKKPLFKPRGVQ